MSPVRKTQKKQQMRKDKRYGCKLCPKRIFDRLKVTDSTSSKASVQYHVHKMHPNVSNWRSVLTQKPSVYSIRKTPRATRNRDRRIKEVEEIPESEHEQESVTLPSLPSQSDDYEVNRNDSATKRDYNPRKSLRLNAGNLDSSEQQNSCTNIGMNKTPQLPQTRKGTVCLDLYAEAFGNANTDLQRRPDITDFERAASVGIYGRLLAKLAKLAFPSLETGRTADDDRFSKWICIAQYMHKKAEYLTEEYDTVEKDRDQLLAERQILVDKLANSISR